MSTTATIQSVNQEQIFYCSFCGKSNKELQHLIAGPNNVYICEKCVEIAVKIIDEERRTATTDR